MRIDEVLATKNQNVEQAAKNRTKDVDGTYVGLKFDTETKRRVEKLMKDVNIPSPTPTDDLHTTLVYSKGKVAPEGFKSQGRLEKPYKLKPSGVDIFGEENDCLVLKLSSDDVYERHKQLKDEGLSHTYDDFSPHITLTYEFDKNNKDHIKALDKLKDMIKHMEPFKAIEEYDQPLEVNWSDKVKKN